MKRATIQTSHGDPQLVASAIRPDNTDDMRTSVIDGGLETHIERESTGGLLTTIDDYLVNLLVVARIEAYEQTDMHTSNDNPETRQ